MLQTRPRSRSPILLTLALAASLTAGGCASLGLGPSGDAVDPSARAEGCVDGVGEGCEGDEEGALQEAEPAALVSVEATTPITSEEVRFASGGDTLTGTVYRPLETDAKRPAVVVLHDYGPTGRDGLFRRAFGVSLPVEVAVYRGLAERLASHGFVVLTYDKRTCVKTAAPWCEYPRRMVEEQRDRLAGALVDDAAAAMAYLGGRDDVDPARLHLVGHGQGADVALALEPTGRRVLLAPSPHPVDALVRHQTARSIEALEAAIAQADGTTGADLWKKQLAELHARQEQESALFTAIREGEAAPDAFGLSPESWRGLIALHDAAMARLEDEQSLPVLAVMGELDLDLPEGSEEEMARRLSKGPSPTGASTTEGGTDGGSELVVVPSLTHLMVDASEGADPTVVSEAVVTAVLEFLVP